MDIDGNIGDDLKESLNIKGEEEVLNIISKKLEDIEEFLTNNTRGNYIRYLKNKDLE